MHCKRLVECVAFVVFIVQLNAEEDSGHNNPERTLPADEDNVPAPIASNPESNGLRATENIAIHDWSVKDIDGSSGEKNLAAEGVITTFAIQLTSQGTTDLALNRPAWSSSSYPGSTPAMAVDGNRNADWSNQSCAGTAANDLNPWWAVDLGQLTTVQRVSLTNRGDCCADRLSSVVVGLTNFPPYMSAPTACTMWICGQGPSAVAAGATINVTCASNLPQARYVVLRSKKEYFTVCEVEVYGVQGIGTDNLALGKQTWMSTAYPGSSSDKAVDGNNSTNWSSNSCAGTGANDLNPWWAVDLGQLTIVQKVTLLNRGDCCADRLNNVVVGLTNSPPNVLSPTACNVWVCGQGPATVAAGALAEVPCASGLPTARYVVLMSNVQYFTVCEVMVFGIPA